MSLSDDDISEALTHLPALSLLSDDVRALVAASFERASFPFGAVIVREGDPGDAFYVIARGTARVVRSGEHGDEVALNILRAGDSFGEMALLAGSPRSATVRASGPLEAIRLERGVFLALTRSNPEVRAVFEAIGRQRALWNFLRLQSAFGALPGEALAILAAGLEPVSVVAGEVVIRKGEPTGPMYIIEEGRLMASGQDAQALGFLRAGDFFGERSLLLDEPRGATVEAVTDAKLLRFPVELFQRLLSNFPEFRARLAERVEQYAYRQSARVPLDFASEILPADVGITEAVPEPATSPSSDTRLAGATELGRGEVPVRRIKRFPHIYQLDEMDCGAACLAMVCRHFGRRVSMGPVRAAVHTTTDGTSLAGLTRGADALGLAARSVRASKSRLDELPLPAIVHWEGNHWVVVYDVTERHVRVSDPARGRRRLPRAEFLEGWSGYASVIERTERLDETPEARTSLGWLWPVVKPHRARIGAAAGMAGLAAAFQLVLPILTQVVVDDVLPNKDVNRLGWLVAAIIVVLVAIMGAAVIQRYLLSWVAVRFDIASLDVVTGRLLDLPMSYFNARRTGDIERRLQGVRQVREFLVDSGVQALTSLTQLVAVVVLMFVYSWVLGLAFVVTLPFYALLMRFSATRLRPVYDSLEHAYGKYQSAQIDAIRGMETVKALAAERQFRGAMLEQFKGLADRIFRAQFLVMIYDAGVQLVALGTMALFLIVGALQVIYADLSIGRFVAFNTLVALANAPLLLLLLLWDRLQLARVQLGRLEDVLEQVPEQGDDRGNLRPVTTLSGAIELRNVGFRYGGPESAPILEGLTFRVGAGERIAIVGRSGSGKTTLVKLLSGLVEATEGTVLYDGFDMRTLDYRTLRRQVGFVLQESYLFDETIAKNIAFGEPAPDMDRVVWAARAASAHEFISRLPLGYETRVGESGLRLSGGQKQRIAIARALYHRPPVLLFDEATSALDTESERAVKESLDELLADRTSFVIAHRLSTIRDADRILVLERGRLVEQGTHEELLARQGLYFYLASQQLEL
jgi:HlyB family type I secretion system ABC transporter